MGYFIYIRKKKILHHSKQRIFTCSAAAWRKINWHIEILFTLVVSLFSLSLIILENFFFLYLLDLLAYTLFISSWNFACQLGSNHGSDNSQFMPSTKFLLCSNVLCMCHALRYCYISSVLSRQLSNMNGL